MNFKGTGCIPNVDSKTYFLHEWKINCPTGLYVKIKRWIFNHNKWVGFQDFFKIISPAPILCRLKIHISCKFHQNRISGFEARTSHGHTSTYYTYKNVNCKHSKLFKFKRRRVSSFMLNSENYKTFVNIYFEIEGQLLKMFGTTFNTSKYKIILVSSTTRRIENVWMWN